MKKRIILYQIKQNWNKGERERERQRERDRDRDRECEKSRTEVRKYWFGKTKVGMNSTENFEFRTQTFSPKQ